MTFLWPWAFALLILPVMVRFSLKPVPKSSNGALRVPFFSRLSAGKATGGQSGARSWILRVLVCLIWLLLVGAAARPAMVGPEIALPIEGRDIMMAMDLSGSMGREDFSLGGRATTRLDVVKTAADDFIARRKGDRIGLILFSDRAYVQAPLTPDREVVRDLLDQAEVGLTGTETAIGDAIAIGVKRLKDRPAPERVMILLTDGASNAGVMQPLEAAGLAKDLGVRIYTIGVGAERMVVNNGFGRQIVDPSRDLDEGTLTKIAQETGGQYFRATDVAGLAGVYTQIDRIEPVADDHETIRPSIGLFYWPLGLALSLSLLATFVFLPLTLPTRRSKEIHS